MLLGDDLALRRIGRAWATLALIGACLLGWAAQLAQDGALLQYALVPALLHAGPTEPAVLLSLLSYQFLHGGWLHLAGNLLMLFIFGDNVEDALHPWRFLLLYLVAGVAGGLLHALMAPASFNPLVGASGAIAGVMAAYLLLYPRAKLLVLAFNRWPALVPASWFVGAWFGVNLLQGMTGGPGDHVAWWAHIGGFLAGLAMLLVLRPPGVALFQPVLASPAPALGWLQRVAFDFAPEALPRHGPAAADTAPRDTRLAAFGKALLFLLLVFLSAWF